MSRLKDFYENEIVPATIEKFSYKNKMAVPKIDKIVINMGVGEAKEDVYKRQLVLSLLQLQYL